MRGAEEQLGAATEAAHLLIRFRPASMEKWRHFVHVSRFFFSLTQPVNGDSGTREAPIFPSAAERESVLVPGRSISAMVITVVIYSP